MRRSLRRLLDTGIQVGLILLLPAVALIALVDSFLTRPLVRDRAAVAGLLRRRLAGAQGRGEWDKFVCLRIIDPRLEAVRQECRRIEEEGGGQFPPVYLSEAGARRMGELLHELEGVEQADAADERAIADEPPARS
jgi:hypothetical protein